MKTEVTPQPIEADEDTDIIHLYCCDETVAWCGESIDEAIDNFTGNESRECVMCVEYFGTDCPKGCNV